MVKISEGKIKKFESEGRLKELDPRNTLKRAGFKEGMVLCDIGAGTGVFSFPAAEISKAEIYALDVSDDMIKILEARKLERKVKNLKVKKVKDEILPLEDESCDLTIMITVLHHIENKKLIISEIKRVLKENGRFMVVEFYKEDTSAGPPVHIKISEEEVERIGNENGLKVMDKFSLGENFYGIVFEVK